MVLALRSLTAIAVIAATLLPIVIVFAARDSGDGGAAIPQLGARADDDEATAKLGFPVAATKHTTRVGGGDAVADLAGVANAVFPATSPETRPSAVVLVDEDDWQGGVAASVLMAPPVGAPPLLSADGELPAVTRDTLERLDPKGSDLLRGAAVIRVGDRPPAPPGRRATVIPGRDAYERAAAIDRYSTVARGRPSAAVVVASGERAEYAMPAAAWAARSGDPVLFATRDAVPEPTIRAIRAHDRPRIFVLGPESVLGPAVERALGRLGRVRRIGAATAVENAIAFARFDFRGFGWGITVPGQNLTLASTSRPLDAAGSAPLATKGTFAPLLLTDDPARLPAALESYLLDLQPGYEENPNRAVFNHVWILGDDRAVSVPAQGRLDEVSELVPVSSARR